MLRFKALNDDDSNSSDSEDESVRNRPTREALEEGAAQLYNQALRLLCDSKNEEATVIFEELLESAYIKDDEEKSPMQVQMRSGCLKNLSIIFAGDSSRYKCAQRVLLEAVSLDPKNVTLWCRLGSIDIKLTEYHEAYLAFQRGLRCSPHHWICVENLVTLAFALGDYLSCLYYCALGLEKDPNFIRGSVFRDEIFDNSPFIVETGKVSLENWENLFPPTQYDPCWKTKYLKEARALIERRREIVSKERENNEEHLNRSLVCTEKLKSYTLTELCQSVFDFKERLLQQGGQALYRPIDMSSCCGDNGVVLIDEESVVDILKKVEAVDESSRHSIHRGRSGSDEKEPNFNNDVGGDKNLQTSSTIEVLRLTDEDCSQSQDTTQEPEPKKKSRKDVKWWQYEGKRRSQRVRGHLMPISQTPSKNERGFSETLKNLIHSSLLCGEPEPDLKENNKSAFENECENYFGNQSEADDVKKFILAYGKTKLIDVITALAPFLCQLKSNSSWPSKLVNQYLESCKHYRLYRQEQSEWMIESDGSISMLRQDATIILSTVEFRLDNATPSTIESLKYDSGFVSDLAYLEIVLANGLKNDRYFSIRYYWFRVNYELLLAQVGLGKYKYGLHYLKLLEKLLEQESPAYNVRLATRQDNIISIEEVRKKIRFVKKMENISRISELYQSHEFEALIEILQLCLTTEDYTSTDLTNRLYLAESYFRVGKFSDCVIHCVKVVTPCLKNRNDEILSNCLGLIESICIGPNSQENLALLSMKDKRLLTNSMIEILTWNENKGALSENIAITPWCVLHSILFALEIKEPALYLDEESAPNSVVLLQFAHEFMNRTNRCALGDGKLLTYTIDVLFAIRKTDDHGSYEETKHCIEQAIFCLYSHPSKKSKLKYLAEHNTNGIELKWEKCIQLFEYYKPEDIPEFDSYQSISTDVEGLFQRILTIMPEDLKPSELDYKEMILVLEGTASEKTSQTNLKFPPEFINIYYLLGDHYFKTKEWIKAVEYYTYDLTVIPSRFDSWAAIALAKGEMISSKLNACESYVVEDVLKNSDIVINCFQRALDLEPNNSKIRIEFGSFVYAMHSFCSRLLKQGAESLSLDKFEMVESKKDALLASAIKCFEPIAKTYGGDSTNTSLKKAGNEDEVDDDDQHELWIHHYLLGKVMEKLNPGEPEKFLHQYEVAGKLLSDQGAPYPAKINFYNPPELAVEALEIYYRIHASILNYIEKHDYDEKMEILLLGYTQRAAASPFVKSKQSRGGGGDTLERKRKAKEDDKKDQMEINGLMDDMLKKVEDILNSESNAPSSSTSSDDDEDGTSVTSSQASTLYSSDEELFNMGSKAQPVPVMSSFGLSAFQEKMREKENLENKRKAQANSVVSKAEAKSNSAPVASVKKLPSMEHNKFYKDFSKVKYGILIAQCLSALEECVIRFPQHHKSYFRLSYTFASLANNNWKISKDYLIGNTTMDKKKISGLFADRKANNFFNGVWRNPVDDIDRPGSFPYHMARTIQHLLEILYRLNDHHLLAEVAIALSKVPEQDKQYLYNSERQQFSQQAFSSCVGAAKRFFSLAEDIKDGVISIFETYQKLQKFNAKDNVLAGVLIDCYKQYLEKFGHRPEETCNITLDQSFKFFQHLTWSSKTTGSVKVVGNKNSGLTGSVVPNLASSTIEDANLNTVIDPSLVIKSTENRKRKEPGNKQSLEKQLSKSSIANSVIQGVSSWPRPEGKCGNEKDTIFPLKKKQTINAHGEHSGMLPKGTHPRLSKSNQPVFYQPDDQLKSSLTVNLSVEKKWKDSCAEDLMKPVSVSKLLPSESDVIDLSQHTAENGKLKRRASVGSAESDPLAILPPKKSHTHREFISSFTEKLSQKFSSEKLLPPTNKSTTTTPISNPKMASTSGGIPFNLFMESLKSNNFQSCEALLEMHKQPSAKRPYDYVNPVTSSSTQPTKYTAPGITSHSKSSISNHAHTLSSITVSKSETGRLSSSTSPYFPSTSLLQAMPRTSKDRPDKIVPAHASSVSQPSKLNSHIHMTKTIPVSMSAFSSSRNTSPFKTQTTMLLNPATDSPHQNIATQGRSKETPPPAHTRSDRTTPDWNANEEPEIIDLTTPPRRKEIAAKYTEPPQACQPAAVKKKPAEETYFVPRAITSNYPLPPKKNIQARHRNISRESSEETEVITLE